MHPFFELTNRTPSPSQKEDSNYRKHSPWTAARHKKKTRSVQQQSGDEAPVYQQAIPEAYDSPGIKTAALEGVLAPASLFKCQQLPVVCSSVSLCLCFIGCAVAAATVKTVGGSAEYSLADCLSPASKSTASPHSSPPVSRGSADDAEVHPSKAYIPDHHQQVPNWFCCVWQQHEQ